MKNLVRMSRVIALLAVLAIVAAACGSGADDDGAAAPTAPNPAEEPAPLPPNPDPGSEPAIGAACLEGEPDCNDTAAPGDEPMDLPPPGDDPGTVSGFVVDGGLSVPDALAGGVSGVIAVKGFLFVDDDGARLCELLAESFPPQCGGASLPITGYEEVLGVPLNTEQGISWTDGYETFLGEIVDGTLVVDPLVAQ